MPDRSRDFDRIFRRLSELERLVATLPRRPALDPKPRAGRGVEIVRFELVGPFDCDVCQATAEVLSRPPGVARVTGEDSYGQIVVFDFAHCFLNEAIEDLTGRQGYAAYLESTNTDCAIDPQVTTHWEIFSLCCNEGTCGG